MKTAAYTVLYITIILALFYTFFTGEYHCINFHPHAAP